MSKHIELANPCPNCQSRLTLSVRRTPLMGFHAVRLACENGCDLHWYYYDLPKRAWFPTVEQCADYHDGVIHREGEENERILAFECPNCGECPHVSSKSIGRQTFPTVTCRCASYWDRDLHSALCGWLTETKNRKNADILEKIGRSTTFRTEPDCPHCGRPPECAWDHTSDLWSVGCGKCDKPNNGVSDDILTAMTSWREHTDAYRRSHDGEGLQNQLTEYWRKRGETS